MEKNKILIVDDEEDIVKITQFRLQNNNYEVLTAMDGESAIELIKKELPNLVLLDIGLPKLSGKEVCSFIKDNPLYKDIIVIIFTASAANFENTASKCKADDRLFKPFETNELLERVKKWLK